MCARANTRQTDALRGLQTRAQKNNSLCVLKLTKLCASEQHSGWKPGEGDFIPNREKELCYLKQQSHEKARLLLLLLLIIIKIARITSYQTLSYTLQCVSSLNLHNKAMR